MQEFVLPEGEISQAWLDQSYQEAGKLAIQASAEVTKADINARLGALRNTPGGFALMAKELKSPLLRESLYEARYTSIFQNYKLGAAEQAFVWADVAVPAAAIGIGGLPQTQEVFSDSTRVDTRVYAALPFVRWVQQTITPFDLLKTVQERAKASLMLQEAAAAYRLIKYASGLRSQQGTIDGFQPVTAPSGTYAGQTSVSSANAPTSIVASVNGKIGIDQIGYSNAAFGSRLIEGTKKLWMNPIHQGDFVTFNQGTAGTATGGLGYFMPQFQESLMKRGYIGDILGSEVIGDIVIPAQENGIYVDSIAQGSTENVMAYHLAPSDFLGVRVIRTDMVVESQKMVGSMSDQLGVYMESGLFIRWVKGIQRFTTN